MFRNTDPYSRWEIGSGYYLPLTDGSSAPEPIEFPEIPDPLVSIIIPLQSSYKHTRMCLNSIKRHEPHTSFEIIIVDDGSSDATQDQIKTIPGIRYLRNESKKGRISARHYGASEARGKYLLFLDNHVQVLPGWLDELVWTLDSVPKSGLVGPKQLFRNGQLLEAGGIVWESGITTSYGKYSDPAEPEFNYLRDVDFVSGACVLVLSEVFRAAFNDETTPFTVNYEDVEFCLKIRELGYRVLYQPSSVVALDSVLNVGSSNSQQQNANQLTFRQRWSKLVSACPTTATPPILAKDWACNKRALVIDQWTPRIDRDSGSIDTIQLFRLLQKFGFKPTFMASEPFHFHDGQYTVSLQRSGTECLYAPYVNSVLHHIEEFGKLYDLVVLTRPSIAALQLEHVQKYCPNAKLIFNTVDLHFLREEREAVLKKDAILQQQAARTKEVEFGLMKAADLTLVVSPAEEELLVKEGPPGIKLRCLPLTRDIPGHVNPFEQRKDILFVGFFGHAPNVDAIDYFASEVWPLIRARIPDAQLLVIGSGISKQHESLNQPGIDLIGYVQDLEPYYNNCRLTVAPLRFGAGSKGKVVASMCHGLPVVATSIAAEGMMCESGIHILVADSSAQFAEAVIELYNNQQLWQKISNNSLALAKELFSFEVVQKIFFEILNTVGLQ